MLVPGQGLWQGVSGISSLNPTVAIHPSMMFGIASNSKAFISTTILSLVDEGKTLEVRGYKGSPMFGRTQLWHRVEVATPPASAPAPTAGTSP